MALVDWDPSFSVKVTRCDDDHKKLFSLVKDLYHAMGAGKSVQVVERVINDLAEYTLYHFTREELLLRKTNYPDFLLHRIQHQEFVQQVQQFQADLKTGKIVHPLAVAEFLNGWLANHIKQTDQRYSAHLNANGVR